MKLLSCPLRAVGLMVLLIASLVPALVVAEQVDGLYHDRQLVESQSQRDLLKATSAGLRTVLIRVSGHSSVTDNAGVKSAIRKPKPFLNQYSYERIRDPESGQERLFVTLDFEQNLVDDLLRREGLPLWPSNRPTILVWVVMDDSEGRRFIGVDNSPVLMAELKAQAERRGLAIKLPLLDLEDNIAIRPDDLWELNRWSAKSAAERYNPDSLLIGRVSRLSNGLLMGNWLFDADGAALRFEGSMADEQQYMAAIVDQIADQLSEQYAIVPVKIAVDGVVIRISGIHGFEEYTRALQYLEGLAAVRHAVPMTVDGDEMLVRLLADGQLEQLQRAFMLDGRLHPAAPLAGETRAIALHYHWPQQP